MPYVSIETNVPEANIPANFTKELSSSAAATIGKDEKVSRLSLCHCNHLVNLDFVVVQR